jgi:hypothetical protein
MNNQLQFCSYEQAKRLKKAGFDWECAMVYDCDLEIPEITEIHDFLNLNSILPTPTVQLALKWMRDVHGKCGVYVYHNQNGANNHYYTKSTDWLKPNPTKYKSYEAAEADLLDEILDIIEQKQ